MAKKKVAKKKGKAKPSSGNPSLPAPTPQRHKASISSDPKPLPTDFADLVDKLSKEISLPVVMLWHGGNENSPLDDLTYRLQLAFYHGLSTLPANTEVAVLLHSPGGFADVAYRLTKMIQNQCGKYNVYIPRWAKSAATLFSLGAEKIVLGTYGELGPLDAQIHDYEREEDRSALEVVQSVERLNREAMTAIDQHMTFWMRRSGKKIDTLLPTATHFVAEMMAPLFDKIDAVDFTKNARVLKVAQDYAIRLLRRKYDRDTAEDIASHLTTQYSDHGFVIDAEEATSIGVHAEEASGAINDILNELSSMRYARIEAIGVLTDAQ
jgi:hypothetical protein